LIRDATIRRADAEEMERLPNKTASPALGRMASRAAPGEASYLPFAPYLSPLQIKLAPDTCRLYGSGRSGLTVPILGY